MARTALARRASVAAAVAAAVLVGVLLAPGTAGARLRGHIVFSSSRGASGPFAGALWTIHADGTHARRLTHSRNGDRDPSWSPSGRFVAFSHYENNEIGSSVWVVRATGRRHRRHVLIRNASQPAWSPSGDWVAVSRLDGIWLVRPDGSGAHRLVEGAGAAWSPDGRRLAVVREFADDSENAVLDVVDVARASATTIFTSPGRGLPRGPVWSGNGRRIVFTRDFLRGDNGELWSIPSAGGQAVRLNGDGDQADVSPDGRHVIFVGGADRLLIGDRRAHHPHDLVGRRNQAWVGEGMNDPDWRR